MPTLPIREVMSARVLTVAPDFPLQHAAAKMSEARVSCVVVCTDDRQPLGVVTERDLTRAYARDLQSSTVPLVSSVMSKGTWTMTENESCERAMRIMSERKIRRMVIVDQMNRLCGVVTRSDMLRAHARELERQKSLLEARVSERTRELRELNVRLESLSLVDPLMEIGNRRAMDGELARMEQRARRYDRPYAVALADVDYFKKFNDRYGHGPGDDVLKRVAATIVTTIRAADAAFRYGGEELLIAFPEVGLEGAMVAAQHVCDAVAALKFPHKESPLGYLTVSIGVAQENMISPNWINTVARADAALYAAKHSGRNQIAAALEADAQAVA